MRALVVMLVDLLDMSGTLMGKVREGPAPRGGGPAVMQRDPQ